MWNLLKQTDIEQAKQDIRLRRAEILRKHAEETQTLDSDRAELEILNHLIDIFTLKFKKPQPEILPHKPTPAPVVQEQVTTKPVEADHARSQRSSGLTPGSAVKVADHVRGVKAHGSSPAMPHPAMPHKDHPAMPHKDHPAMPHKEGRFNPADSRGGASREPRHHHGHKHPRTNFEVFSRALARELALDER
jgi:hypothetical protein